jgi:hypothetical protein
VLGHDLEEGDSGTGRRVTSLPALDRGAGDADQLGELALAEAHSDPSLLWKVELPASSQDALHKSFRIGAGATTVVAVPVLPRACDGGDLMWSLA